MQVKAFERYIPLDISRRAIEQGTTKKCRTALHYNFVYFTNMHEITVWYRNIMIQHALRY